MPSELEAFEARIRGETDPADGDPRRAQSEEAIAACMAEVGFEYHPEVPTSSYHYSRPLVLTREHAEAIGYGETLPPAPGVAPSRWAYQLAQSPGEKANALYRESLSLEAADAYWSSLHGEVPADATAPTILGCHESGMTAVYADVMVPEPFRAAETAILRARRDVERDSVVADAVGRWADCMAGAGHPGLEDRHDGRRVVTDRVDAFPAPAGMPFEEIAKVYADELAEIQAFERSVALADVGCLESTGFYTAWEDARTRIQGQVVATYRADLEAWAAWAEEKRAARP